MIKNPKVNFDNADLPTMFKIFSDTIKQLNVVYDEIQTGDEDIDNEEQVASEYITFYMGVEGYDVRPFVMNKGLLMNFIERAHIVYKDLYKQIEDIHTGLNGEGSY